MNKTLTRLTRDGLYRIYDYISREEKRKLGLDPDKSLYFSNNVKAKWTGEKRCPKKGEWYLSGAIIEAYKAPNDLLTPYHIAKLVRTETSFPNSHKG